MKILLISLLLIFFVSLTHSQESSRQKLQQELKTLNQKLKPLREKAYRESKVITARKKVDTAFRNYYQVLRAEMKKLDPEQAADIQRVIELRESLYGKHGGSRAEDYEKKAEATTAQ